MIYLIIALIVSQIIHFIFYQRILDSIKRRSKIIDNRVRNLSQWICSNQQSISKNLEKIQELVFSQYFRSRTQEMNMTSNQAAETTDSISISMHLQQQSHKEVQEKIKLEDIQHYYAILLHELQQLDTNISKVRQQSEMELHNLNQLNTSLFKNELMNRLNSFGKK
jgi:uncharacterized circularly permuted ATP-grasp superfamily protein